MPTSLSNITVKDSSHTLIVKSNDITIDGTSIQTQINNKANDADVVHKTGNESISGVKTFSSAIQRTANLGSGGTALFNLTDTNGKGSVNQSSYYVNGALYNRLNTVNATSNKEGYIEVQNRDNGAFTASINGNGTNLSLTRVVSATTDTEVPTKGWVNNPDTSTNVIHRTGNEEKSGNLTLTSGAIYKLKGYSDFSELTKSSAHVILEATDLTNNSVTSLYNYRSYNSQEGKSQTGYWFRAHKYGENTSYADLRNMIADDGQNFALIYTGGGNLSNTYNYNLVYSTSSTSDTLLATMGWVNNPATSTNVVHRSGDETINGNKTINDALYFNGVFRGKNISFQTISLNDCVSTGSSETLYYYCTSNGASANITDKPIADQDTFLLETSMIRNFSSTDHIIFQKYYGAKESCIYFRSCKNGTWTSWKKLFLGDTSEYLTTLTPATSDNSTKIATTAWVKAQGYSSGGQATWGSVTGTLSNQTDLQNALNAKAADSDVVKLTGNQTIAGNKTFTSTPTIKMTQPNLYMQYSGISKGTAPTSTIDGWFGTVYDKNGTAQTNKMAQIYHDYNSNGVSTLNLAVFEPTSGSTNDAKLTIGYDQNKNVFTYAPTPATSDNSTKIATTAFVKAQGYITSSGSITGSAAKLTTKRTIDGVEFDGSANITHYGTCDTAAATQEKVVACTGFKLETGAVIFVKFTAEANGADNPTLNVNSTGAKAIQYRGSAINKGYLRINRTYVFVYDGTYYQLIGDLDSNTTDRLQIANNIKAATAITAGRAIVGTSAGYKNIGSGITFDISYPILVAGSAISASGTGTNNFRAISGRSVRDITGNSSWTGTQYATVYLVLSALNGVTATIDSTLVTTTVPSSADNKFYIPIGYTYSTYQCYFCPQDKIYAYTNGKFQEYGSASGDTSDCVKLTGNQTIAGTKTFSNVPIVLKDGDMRVRYQSSVYTQGTAPSSNCYGGSRITDKNNVEMGSVYTGMYTDGSVSSRLFVKSPVAGTNSGATLGISCNASGSFYTEAPTPAVSDNSTKIATTAYCNSKHQVVSALPASPNANVFYYIPA